ncbi:holo-ACP synthase [Cellulomonas sp. KRMCY2]|uniref:holo-ACP synthase n=1 Tax=Cellulomonas sp. KRMCY2 TaxID=1304865 RepID=UPI0004B44418|nr:4'-phosphopantetheinyl transferase superfamily protein [Cellulomonas sp. KRMCY2]
MSTPSIDPKPRYDPGCPSPRASSGRRRSGATGTAGAAGAGSTPGRPIAIGVDVVDVPRFARMVALRGPTLGGMVFTPRELETCRGSLPRLAVRFAAKEATAKALGLGIGPVAWREVETRTRTRG